MSREKTTEYGEKPVPLEPGYRNRSPFPAQANENSISRLRDDAFRLAGLTPEVVAKQLERAISVYIEGMEATRTETVSYHGEIVSQTQVVDHATRIRAAEGWASLTGVSASKASLAGANSGPPQVSIILSAPFIADLEISTRDVTPPTDVEVQDEQQ